MQENALNQLQQYKTAITEQLEIAKNDKKKRFGGVKGWGIESLNRLLEFSKNGKMIRGALLLFGTEMFGQKIASEHLKAAAALKLIQSAILIHDDIIDQDSLRRGKPTMHTQFQTVGLNRKLNSPAQFGISLAICVGDIGFFLAFELLNSLTVLPEIKTWITQLILEEIQLVQLAQMQDVFFSATSKQIEETEILKLYQFKTGRYTFSLPLTCAALFTEQPTPVITKITQLGEYLGILFQLKDDELSLFGTSENTGKPVGTDINRNNKTLYRYYLYKCAIPTEKKRLNNIFGNRASTKSNIRYVTDLLRTYQIPKLVQEKIRAVEQEVRIVLKRQPENHKLNALALSLLEFNSARSK